MFCTACATPNPRDARQCAACGATLTGLLAPRRPAAPSPRRLNRIAARLLYLIPVLGLLGAALGVGARVRSEQTAQAAAYARGQAAEAAGQYELALVAYRDAGGYRDADARREAVDAILAPYRAAYLDGLAALESGDYAAAVAAFAPVVRDLPAYADAPVLLTEARRRWTEDLAYQAEQAANRRDWIAAENYLATLLAEDPENAALATRLATMRREHAPILFTQNHMVFVAGPDLGDKRLVSGSVPASLPIWSPDRSLIAFIGQRPQDLSGNNYLYVVNLDGSDLRWLADHVDAARAPIWSPDGRTIAYSSQEQSISIPTGTRFSVRTVEVATGKVQILAESRLQYAASPTWSPRGDRLAVIGSEDNPRPGRRGTADPEIFVVTLATGELINISRGRIADAYLLAWSPVDDRLLIYSQRPAGFRRDEATSIRLLDLGTDEMTTLDVGGQPVMPPVWSPDGSRFAFVEGDTVIRVRTYGRGEAWLSVRSPLSGDLTWSPDGATLLAAAVDPQQSSYFLALGPQLGQQEPIALAYDPSPYPGPPQWSPLHPAAISGPTTIGGTALDA